MQPYVFWGMSTHTRVRILVFVAPVVFTLAALALLAEALIFTSSAERVQAEVTKVYDHGDGTFSPVLRYDGPQGPVDAGLWVSSESYDFPVGSFLTVLADPSDPWTVRLDDFQSVWGLPAVIGAIAVPCWAVALAIWPWARRRWPRDSELEAV